MIYCKNCLRIVRSLTLMSRLFINVQKGISRLPGNSICNPLYLHNVMFYFNKGYIQQDKIERDMILSIGNWLDCEKWAGGCNGAAGKYEGLVTSAENSSCNVDQII